MLSLLKDNTFKISKQTNKIKMAPREIAIATKYDRKFTEFERHFTAYGIKCIQLKTWDVREFKKWLKDTPKQHIAVLQ